MSSRTCFATAFYHAQGYAPNLGRFGNLDKFSAYYKCMVVLFASLRRQYRSEKLIVFTNCSIDAKYQVLLDMLDVSTVIIPKEKITYVVDNDIVNHFPGCLFSLDVFKFVANSTLIDEIDSLFLLDSDCILIDSMDEVINQVEQNDAIVGIRDDTDTHNNMNGQTRSTLTSIFNRFASESDRNRLEMIDYFGGEFYGFSSSRLFLLCDLVKQYWQFIKVQTPTFGNEYTEEHVLSMVLNQMHDKLFFGQNVIKRTWTADAYRNIDGSELRFSLLHMPAEKNKLFRDLFRSYSRDANFFNKLSTNELKEIVDRRLKNVVKSSFVRDCLIKVKGVVGRTVRAM